MLKEETPQSLTKSSLQSISPADTKSASTPKSRLGASRRETRFVESPSVSLEEHVCVVKNCNKTFRKHSLLQCTSCMAVVHTEVIRSLPLPSQMHLKHYHPGTGGRLGSVPNVADLAYARTAQGLLEPGNTLFADRRRKRHRLSSPPESKRRKLEGAGRRKKRGVPLHEVLFVDENVITFTMLKRFIYLTGAASVT
ncbi:hypothetical protein FHG87_013573 [Trinorchestia longiramus]|nr:hypothetical protein FHG87_013573 [Trinorchestia longiramus]